LNTATFNQPLIETIVQDRPHDDLHTIKDFLRWTYSTFNRADIYYGHGYDNAWDEAQQLIFAALQVAPDIPQALYDAQLTRSEKTQLIELVVARLQKRIPVAYLTNRAWFCGLEFYVDERVIIPRSPISALIQDRFSGLLNKEPTRILDMCTGSGCIAIACAQQFPHAEVDAVDLSLDALNVAEINIDQYHLNHRVYPIQSNLFTDLAADKYDLIVTNPPYVDADDIADMPQEFHYEPEMALGSGHDGLHITRQILASASDYLADDGVLICEVGNSMVHLIAQFPQVPFQWLELKNGGLGVFAISRADLLAYQAAFKQAVYQPRDI